jgi:drug/metabolite transporter (DMT)-like permease
VAEVPYIPAESVTQERRPAVGYAMVLAAATLFALNGTVSKVVLVSGLPELRLTQVRCTGALIGLAAIVLLTNPRSLRTTRRDLVFLAAFGVFGVALVQLWYFLSIKRLEIGISLLIQFTAPLLVALWARFFLKEHVRKRLWIALVLALVGLSLVVNIWGGVSLDSWGVIFGFCSAVTFAAYLFLAEHAVGRRDTISLLCFGFFFASVFWAIAQPWWSFPYEVPGRSVSLLGNLAEHSLPIWALLVWVIVPGTIVPFFLMVGSLRHVKATRVAVLAMLEPVVASAVAFAWLDETLGVQQLIGGGVVLVGIILAQTAREEHPP